MDEHIIVAIINLDEAKTLLAIEKLDNSFAGTDHLSWHCGATRRTAKASTAATARATATETAAKATTTRGTKTTGTVTATHFTGERGAIKIIVTKTITLVPATATTLVIKTHIETSTFSLPIFAGPHGLGQ
jgi:hypothetical protein